jgi:hypothetical protein
MRATISPADYEGEWLYWQEEPWGPYRDNLHFAMLCREVIRPYLRKGAKVQIEDFMLRPEEQKKASRVDAFLQQLFAISKPRKKGDGPVAVPTRKAKRAKR